MAKRNGFDYIVFDGQRVTNNLNPDSGAHSHLVIDAAGYTFEAICRDTDCPVLIEWEDEQDRLAEQEEWEAEMQTTYDEFWGPSAPLPSYMS